MQYPRYKKNKALEILSKLQQLNAEIYGINLYTNTNGRIEINNSLSFFISEKVKTPDYYRSDANYKKIKQFINLSPEDSELLFFYDFPNDEIQYILSGVTKVYDKFNARKMMDYIKKNRYSLFGIDGLYITDKYTKPSMEHSIDFSAEPHKDIDYRSDSTYKLAEEYLESSPENIYFEFVYER